MRRRPPRSTRTDTLFPTRRSSDLIRRTALRNAVAGVTTRRSATLADALAGAAEGDFVFVRPETLQTLRSEEHTSELQSLMRISYAVFCLKKKNNNIYKTASTDKQPRTC